MGCSASVNPAPSSPVQSLRERVTINTRKDSNFNSLVPGKNVLRAQRSGPAGHDLLLRSHDIVRTSENIASVADLVQIYKGDLIFVSSISCNKSQVRIFTSSTFVDFKDWRNKLMEDVYPFLQELCGILGLEFSVVDMRWGVRESAADDHGTSKLCMQEITRCQSLSLGINFVSFLGNRYGYRPFPAVIPDPDFSVLLANISDTLSKDLLQLWFKKDINRSNPPVHRLQSVSSVYPDFISVEAVKQKAASAKWWADFETMQLALRRAASYLPDDCKLKRLFTISVTHEEVLHGILENERRNDEALVFTRAVDAGCPWTMLRYKSVSTPTDTSQDMGHEEVYICPDNADLLRSFSDWTEPLGALDKEAYAAQMQLINEELPRSGFDIERKLKAYTVNWADVWQGWGSENYAAHVEQFADDFCLGVAEGVFRGYLSSHVRRPVHCEEVLGQLWAIMEKSKAYVGDVGASAAIVAYLSTLNPSIPVDSDCSLTNSAAACQPSLSVMVVCGDSGYGKTTSLCRAISDWNTLVHDGKVPKCNVISRLLGTSAATADVRSLLISLSVQLSFLYGTNINTTSVVDAITERCSSLPYAKLEQVFHALVTSKPTAAAPLVIVLDSLDQLDDSYNGRSLAWLPLTWQNQYLRIVVSTLLTVGPSYKVLEQAFPDESTRAGHWFHIHALYPHTVECILGNMQELHSVKFIPEQMNTLLDACLANPSPLYLRLSFDRALANWHSYTPASQITLSPTVEESIRLFFLSLEKVHGHLLISHALGYITCAGPAGITQAELEDVLSCDDEVLDDVYQWWVPPSRRLPPLIWARARSDIGAYLVEKGTADKSGARVYSWYHRQFREVAEKMYVPFDTTSGARNKVFQGHGSTRSCRHKMLAMYFGNAFYEGVRHTTAKSTDPSVVHNRSVRSMSLLLHDGPLQSSAADHGKHGEESFFSGSSVKSYHPIANIRRLSQQVYHECRAGMVSALKNSIGALDFIIAKSSFASLIQSMRQDIVDVHAALQELIESESTIDTDVSADVEHVRSMMRFVQRHIGDCGVSGMSWTQVARDEPDSETCLKAVLKQFECQYGSPEVKDVNPSFYREACKSSIMYLQPWCKAKSVSPCYMAIQANAEYVYWLRLALNDTMVISIGSGQSEGLLVEMWNISSGESVRCLKDARFFSCSEDGETVVFVTLDPDPGEDLVYSTPKSRVSVYHLASWKLLFSVRVNISTYDRTEDTVLINATGTLLLVLLKKISLGSSDASDKVLLWDIKNQHFVGSIHLTIPFNSFVPLINSAGNTVIIAGPDKHTAQCYILKPFEKLTTTTESEAEPLQCTWEFFVGSRGNDIRNASFTKDEKLVSFSQDSNIFLVDSSSGELKAIVPFGNIPLHHAPNQVVYAAPKSGEHKGKIVFFPISDFIEAVNNLELGNAQKAMIQPREAPRTREVRPAQALTKGVDNNSVYPGTSDSGSEMSEEDMKRGQTRLIALVKDMTRVITTEKMCEEIRNIQLTPDEKMLIVGDTSCLQGWFVPSGVKCISWTGSFYSGMVITSNLEIIANHENQIHFYADKRLHAPIIADNLDGDVISVFKEQTWGSRFSTFKTCLQDECTPLIVTVSDEDVSCIHEIKPADVEATTQQTKPRRRFSFDSDSDSDFGYSYNALSTACNMSKCRIGLHFYNIMSGMKEKCVCVPGLSPGSISMVFGESMSLLYISGRDEKYEDCIIKYDLRSALTSNTIDPSANFIIENYSCPSLDTKDGPMLCLSSDMKVLAAGIGHDIRIFDTTTSPMSARLSFSGHISFITEIVLSGTGHVVVSTSGAQDPRKTITGRGNDYFRDTHIVWNGLTGEIARKITGRSASGNVCLTASGELLAHYTYEKLVCVEQAVSGEVLWILREGIESVRVGCRLNFALNDTILFGSFENRATHVWEISTGELKRTLMTEAMAHVGAVEVKDKSTGGRRAVIYARGEGLQVWEVTDV